MPVQVHRIKIQNILGIESAEIRPGKITVFRGRNGSGKTSCLDAIRAALNGGHDATLLRKGEKKGEIVLVLNDGREIRKTVTAEKSTSTVTHPEFGPLKRTAEALDKLRDKFSLNPVDFLLAKKEDRLKLLLQAIPLTVNPIDLADILPLCAAPPDTDAHALTVLNKIETDLFDQRTNSNRTLKEKQQAATEMRNALPPEAADGQSSAETLKQAREALAALTAEWEEISGEIKSAAERLKESVKSARDLMIETLKRERDAELERISAEFAGRIEGARTEANRRLESIANRTQADFDEQAESRNARGQELNQTIATSEAAAQAFTRAIGVREHIAMLDKATGVAMDRSEKLTRALDELKALRAALLDKLPIRGIEVKDGDIYADGLPFDRVNESRRVRLTMDIAMLRAGELPLLCVDGIERLDSVSIDAVEGAALEMGIQLVMAQVTDGDLETVTD